MSKKTQPYRSGTRKDSARMRFASWLVLPESQRQPRTQRELAKELGVAMSTLSEWRRLPVIQAIVQDWRDSYKASFSAVVDALFRRARNGNVPAARLIAEILGELSPTKIEQTTNNPWLETLSEIRDMRAGTLKALPGGKERAKNSA